MTSAYFEDHPTDSDKVILRKPRLDQGPDYERGFIDGMMYQTQTSVYRAVDAMSKRKWVGLTEEDKESFWTADQMSPKEWDELYAAVEAKLKEKNT
jgi:hypothetical protein